jgi:hypothetical protein
MKSLKVCNEQQNGRVSAVCSGRTTYIVTMACLVKLVMQANDFSDLQKFMNKFHWLLLRTQWVEIKLHDP